MSKPQYTVLSLIIITGIWLTSSADAQCVMAGDVAWEFRVSDAVFVGTVLSNRPTGEIGHHVESDIGTLRIERVWKGRPPKTVDVRADAPFVVGKRYLVFANGQPLSTTIECNWTQLEDASVEKLKWLNRR